MSKEFFRFIIAGSVNTLLSWLIFVALVQYLAYLVAYSMAYVFGILVSYYLNVKFVFRESIMLESIIKYPLIYLSQYFCGMILMWIIAGQLKLPPQVAMGIVITMTVPITFLISRKLIKKSEQAKED